MTEKLDLDAIEARYKALDERLGRRAWTLEDLDNDELFTVYGGDGNVVCYGIKERQSFIVYARADIPALVAEVRRLRASLEAVEETISDIITECRSALTDVEKEGK